MASQDIEKTDQKGEVAHIETITSHDSTIEKEHANYDRIDAEVAKYTVDEGVRIDAAESNRLKKMIDKRILVIMILTYFLQAIDKGTMSFASIMGVLEDTGTSKTVYPWLTTCVYLAVLVVEYPTNRIIQRVPIAKYLSINIMLWGTTLALHGACTNFASLVAVRTLLGIFEAACQPSFLILSSMWYKGEEQIAVVTYWYMMNGAQQIVGGLLAYCFSLIPRGRAIASWQALFISYGGFAVLWGIFVLFWMPDSPMRAKCFSEDDKRLMVERVRSNQTGIQNKTWRREQVIEAFKDPQMWCYCLIAIMTTLPTSGLGAFANIIITSFGFTLLQTQLLAMVFGFYLIIVMLSSTWLVKKTGQSLLVMLGYCVPSFIGTIFLMTLQPTTFSHRVGLIICYCITLSFWAAQTLSMSLLSRNVAGQTKKSIVVSANFVSWAVGNAIGPQVFLGWDAPRYFIAFSVHLGCYCSLVLAILFLRWWLIWENNRKNRLREQGVREAEEVIGKVHAFEDLTDRANLGFRYAF